jgi:rifampicin phosphotransferase
MMQATDVVKPASGTTPAPAVIWLSECGAGLEQVGGKAINLMRLTSAGFDVPPGYVVATDVYRSFIEAAGLGARIEELLSTACDGVVDLLEQRTAEIRALIDGAPIVPELADAIIGAYARLGSDRPVAVRSSGTAEDLAEASFAGMHDTYLDVRGAEALLDAVKRCWASMWTARATSYRSGKGIGHGEAGIAVVVQAMVESDVAGVMFTGNPITTATDEIVINATWGLGESLVQGVVNPDQFIVADDDLRVKARTLGSKQVKVVRDPDHGVGTVEMPVAAEEQARFALSDEQIAEVADVGRRVREFYGELPQDIEWAIAGERLYLLQARPVTGVEFSWDEHVNRCMVRPELNDECWTRSWADMAWTGAITPLMFSWRAPSWERGHRHMSRLIGHQDLADTRLWKFHKAEAYYNCRLDHLMVSKIVPPPLRPVLLEHIPLTRRAEVLQAPFSYLTWLRMFARLRALEPEQGLYRWFSVLERDYHTDRVPAYNGLPAEALTKLSDQALMDYMQGQIELEHRYNESLWAGYIIYYQQALALLYLIVSRFYDGESQAAFVELTTGSRVRTATAIESVTLWQLAQRIRGSQTLSDTFERYQDGNFFARLEESEDGRAFLAEYRAFIERSGHRGHEDRDIYFPRRADDPSIDYRALRALLSASASDERDPVREERRVNQARNARYEEVVANIRRKPLGALKAEAFKLVFDYVHRFIPLRDEERNFIDRSTYSIRLASLEIGRRLLQCGQIETDRDFWFLSVDELFELFRGHASPALTRAKIQGRMRDFDRFHKREIRLPKSVPGSGDRPGPETGRGGDTGRSPRCRHQPGRVHRHGAGGRAPEGHRQGAGRRCPCDAQHRSGLDAGVRADQGDRARDRRDVRARLAAGPRVRLPGSSGRGRHVPHPGRRDDCARRSGRRRHRARSRRRRSERRCPMITAADEALHPPNDDPYWNESTYFGFNVPERSINGWVYFYFRPNQNYMVGGAAVWDPSGRYTWDCLHHNWGDTLAIPDGAEMYDFTLPSGLTVKCVEPLEQYSLAYVHDRCELDLTWRAYMAPDETILPEGTDDWGYHHFEHGGRLTGWLRLDGEEIEIDCGSFRDHSWGSRRHKSNPRAGFSMALGAQSSSFGLWSLSPHSIDEDPFAEVTDRIAMGWYRREDEVAKLVSGERTVAKRTEDGRPSLVTLSAVDALGRELHAEGHAVNWLVWGGYPSLYTCFTGMDWHVDGQHVFGEEQEFCRIEQARRFLRPLGAALA